MDGDGLIAHHAQDPQAAARVTPDRPRGRQARSIHQTKTLGCTHFDIALGYQPCRVQRVHTGGGRQAHQPRARQNVRLEPQACIAAERLQLDRTSAPRADGLLHGQNHGAAGGGPGAEQDVTPLGGAQTLP